MTPTGPTLTPSSADLSDEQLADLLELVETGPVDLGAYTQAELAVVLGQLPALGAGFESDVLAEAVRSLAARGLLFSDPGDDFVNVVGDLGLVLALISIRLGTLDLRRGHEGPANEPWRWLISIFPGGLVAVDRIDALGLHRLSLLSSKGLADEMADRLLDGGASIPDGLEAPIPVPAATVRDVAAKAAARWQIIYQAPQSDGTMLTVDSMLLRTGTNRVDLVTRAPDGSEDYQRIAVDDDTLRDYLMQLSQLQ